MDKQERGLLLVEREEAENNIKNMKEQLRGIGKILSGIGSVLYNDPGSLSFMNAPIKIENTGTFSGHANRYDWNEFKKIESLPNLVAELHKENSRLQDLQLKLRQ